MAKNTSKRKKDIKSKLIAAICMLLVSTIMMVSSTYAWFTLSTAPEVKGITTTIGSNGALEIALSPQSGLSSDVKDATLNDANALYTVKNLTWGNLLDLRDASYGLEKMTLSPTVLLVESGKLATSPLGTPTYGSDGRISGLNTESTMIAGLNENKTGYISGGYYGVRAVGSTSGMSTQQLGFKSNLAAISNYATKATEAASASISANGSALASMLVQHARADGTDSNNYAQYVPALVELTTALDTSVTNMKEAVRAALMTAAATETDETKYALAIESLKAATWEDTTDSEGNTVTGLKSLASSKDSMKTVVEKIAKIETVVSKAQEEAADLQAILNDGDTSNDVINWTAAGPVLTCLMDTTNGVIEVNGDSIDDLKSKMNDTDYIVGMVSDGIVITLGKDSGVYYDIAEVAGNITATTTATVDSGTSLGTVTLKNVVIKTVYSGTSYLPALKTALSTAITPAGNSGTAVMDTFYGYVIDLMFRTNAADSKLLLQTEAAQRVYDDSNNADTLGGGATLTFTNISSANANSVKGLVQSIRIVFFDPSGETIYGIAKATSVVTTEVDTGNKDDDDNAIYTYTITGRLELCAYTVDPTTNQVTVGDALTDSDLNTTYNDGAVLCELSQNVAKAVSCLVYLDGTDVTNADVLYNADVLGALNLQFASSVNLEPMDNAELFNGTTAAADSD